MAKTMQEIEELTKAFAERREALAREMTTLEGAIARLKDNRRAAIRELVGDLAEAHSELSLAIEDSPELFTRPRTRALHGIKVGFQKQPGQVRFENAGQVVKLIRKHLENQADTLIRVSETPAKKALSQLSGAELKKIGVTITDTSDAVLIKPADSEIDKWIDALLADDDPATAEAA